MLCLWCSENSQDKDGDAGNVLHFRSSQAQYCEFAAARSEQKKLKRSKAFEKAPNREVISFCYFFSGGGT
jgi:hypothetical protein